MTEPPGDLDSGEMQATPHRAPAGGMPRWVKVSLIVVLALALLFLVGKLTGLGGEHGPGRHGDGGQTPSAVVNDDGDHRPPVEHGR
jgi:hypothetical protein